MLLSVSNEGHPDHHLFYGNLSGTGAIAQLWVASLKSQKKKNKIKNSVYRKKSAMPK